MNENNKVFIYVENEIKNQKLVENYKNFVGLFIDANEHSVANKATVSKKINKSLSKPYFIITDKVLIKELLQGRDHKTLDLEALLFVYKQEVLAHMSRLKIEDRAKLEVMMLRADTGKDYNFFREDGPGISAISIVDTMPVEATFEIRMLKNLNEVVSGAKLQ